jgi:hypothetical protein
MPTKSDSAAVAALTIRIVGAECWLELKHHWNLEDETITSRPPDGILNLPGPDAVIETRGF